LPKFWWFSKILANFWEDLRNLSKYFHKNTKNNIILLMEICKNTQNKQNFRAARAKIIKTLPKMISEICDW